MTDDIDAAADSPAVETVTPASEPAQATETTTASPQETAPRPSMDETLRAAWDKLNPRRDDTGRFAARQDATEAPAEQVPADQTAETAQPEPAVPAIDAPISWSAEQKAKWASVPPDLQAYIAQRDKESHEAISRAGQQIKAFEPIAQVLNHYAETFKRNGLRPEDGIGRLLAVEENLARDPVATIKDIAKAYGVDLSTMASGQPDAAQAQEQGTPHPEVSTLKAELAQTRSELGKVMSYLTAQQRSQIEGEQQALARQIAEFAKDKPHFEVVRRHMGALMQADETLTLDAAYEQATWALPNIRQSILADQQKANEEKRAEEAKRKAETARKAAATNVRSSTSSGTTPRTMDQTLRETARRLFPDARL